MESEYSFGILKLTLLKLLDCLLDLLSCELLIFGSILILRIVGCSLFHSTAYHSNILEGSCCRIRLL